MRPELPTQPDAPSLDAPPPDAPLAPGLVALGLLALVVVAVVGGVVSVLLTPLAVGATLVPVAVVLAAAVNVVVPRLAWGLTGSRGAAVGTVAAFAVTWYVLSLAGGGDVLLPGGSSTQTAISFGCLGAGLLAGVVTVMRLRAPGE